MNYFKQKRLVRSFSLCIAIAAIVALDNSSLIANTISIVESASSVGTADPEKGFYVTANQYCEFLNAVATIEDTYQLYDVRMAGGAETPALINRSEFNSSYGYSAVAGKEDSPIIYVNDSNQQRFCNWLHNGQPSGKQELETTETGAYALNNIANAIVPINKNAQCYLKFIKNGAESEMGFCIIRADSQIRRTLAADPNNGYSNNPGGDGYSNIPGGTSTNDNSSSTNSSGNDSGSNGGSDAGGGDNGGGDGGGSDGGGW